MENKKYELVKDDTIQLFGKTLYRIKSIKSFGDVNAGELGGYIESEKNLSQLGLAWIYDKAIVYGNATVCGNATVYGNATICGNATVCENATVCGNATVCENATVCRSATVSGNALVKSCDDYITITGLGRINRTTTFFRSYAEPKIEIQVICGCFFGNLHEFEEQVIKTHGDTKYAKEYLAMIKVAKIHFDE